MAEPYGRTRQSVIGVASAALMALVQFGGGAQAQPPPSFWIGPPYQSLRAAWPREASGRFIYGTIKLNCAVGGDAKPTDCQLQSTVPERPELVDAAPKLAALFTAAMPLQEGRKDLTISMIADTVPAFVRRPDGDDIARVYPRFAMQRRRGGMATLHCWIQINGRLRDCVLQDQVPPGQGFGNAALELAPIIRMKPATREGQPIESEVTIPLTFTPPLN